MTHNYIVLVDDKKNMEPPTVVCGCGWSFGPSNRLSMLKTKAFNHKMDTGHKIGDKK
jgi:hypothetical protein